MIAIYIYIYVHRKVIYKQHKLTYKRFNQRKSER